MFKIAKLVIDVDEMKLVSAKLPLGMHQKLKSLAKEKKITMQRLLFEACNDVLKKNNKPPTDIAKVSRPRSSSPRHRLRTTDYDIR